MCGIAGCVLEPGGEHQPARLEAMRTAMGHRGPDGSRVEILGPVGLVHTRLAIVDLNERASQPMRHPTGNWWLSYNGEIYNHGELRDELGDVGFTGTSDTETLLFALEHWGPDVVARLNGQFAFAALDPAGSRLLLCRDRFGVKPLYLARFGGAVWFASEPEALVAAGASPEPVPGAWESVTSGAYLGGEATLMSSITRVGPGSWATIALDTAEVSHSRWQLPAAVVDAPRARHLAGRSRRELTSELDDTLRGAVHGALLADTSVGVLLSGGLDSSLIAALALERLPNLVAFGASCAEDGPLDEGPAIRRVAKALGLEFELLEVTPSSWREFFVSATLHHGGPIANASAVTVAHLADRARRAGVKVVLTGEGADELFGGYDLMHNASLAAVLPRSYRYIRQLESFLPRRPELRSMPAELVTRARQVAADLLYRPSGGATWRSHLTPATGRTDISEALEAYGDHDGPRRDFEARLLTDLAFTICWLLTRMDKNVMQASVEARVPYLDPNLVALVQNLPLEARVGPWSKGILRDVARRHLPLSIAHRPKVYGMGFDAAGWIEAAATPTFLTQGVLRDWMELPKSEFQHATSPGADSKVRLRLWSAEVWCRSQLEGHSIEQIEEALWR